METRKVKCCALCQNNPIYPTDGFSIIIDLKVEKAKIPYPDSSIRELQTNG